MQKLLARPLRERSVRADQAPHLLLPERVWVIGAEHDAILAHGTDEEGERLTAEDGRIDVEAIDIGGWHTRTVLADDVPVAPGIVDPSDEVGETAAAVGEAQLQRARQSLERARRMSHRIDR